MSDWWQAASTESTASDGGNTSTEGGRRMATNSIKSGIAGGLVGGIVGSLLFALANEAVLSAGSILARQTAVALLLPMSIAFFVAAWPELMAGLISRAVRVGGISAVVGAFAGALGLVAGDQVYYLIRDGDAAKGRALVAAWCIVAMLVGLFVGLVTSFRKALIGLCGGLAGGLVGGLVFIAIGGIEDPTTAEVLVAGPIVATILGGAIGTAERIARHTWVEFIEGPLGGREVILYRSPTKLGTGTSDDIVFPDESLSPDYAHLVTRPDGQIAIDLQSGNKALINGQERSGAIDLTASDVVRIGSNYFKVHAR